jgi:hypothetical protein
MIRKVREGWPDGSDTIAEEVARLNAKNCRPHRRDERTQTNDWVAAVCAEDRPHEDREGYMVRRAHLTSQGEGSRTD